MIRDGQTDQPPVGQGPGRAQSRNLPQQAHRLDRLARPRLHAGGDRAHVSVDRGAGAEGKGGEAVRILPHDQEAPEKTDPDSA